MTAGPVVCCVAKEVVRCCWRIWLSELITWTGWHKCSPGTSQYSFCVSAYFHTSLAYHRDHGTTRSSFFLNAAHFIRWWGDISRFSAPTTGSGLSPAWPSAAFYLSSSPPGFSLTSTTLSSDTSGFSLQEGFMILKILFWSNKGGDTCKHFFLCFEWCFRQFC